MYFYLRKNGVGRALNDPPTLLTDRGAYVNFLEIQLERVSAACLGVQGYDDKINDLHTYVTSLEQRCLNNTKLVDIAQQCTLELRSENDSKHKALSESVRSEHMDMQRVMQAMSTRISAVEQSISILPVLQSKIDTIEARIDKLDQRQASFEVVTCHRDDEVAISLDSLRDDATSLRSSINELTTAVSKQSFELQETESRFKESVANVESSAKSGLEGIGDEMNRRHEVVMSEMHFGFDKLQTDSASREAGCLAAIRLHKETAAEELSILKSVITKRQDATDANITERIQQLRVELDALKSSDTVLGNRINSAQNDVNDLRTETSKQFGDFDAHLRGTLDALHSHSTRLDEVANFAENVDKHLQETTSSFHDLDHDVSSLETLVQVLRDRLEEEILCEPIPVPANQPTRRQKGRPHAGRPSRSTNEAATTGQMRNQTRFNQHYDAEQGFAATGASVQPTPRYQVQKNDNAVGVATAQSSRVETLLRSTAHLNPVAKNNRIYTPAGDLAVSSALTRAQAAISNRFTNPGSPAAASPKKADISLSEEAMLQEKLANIHIVDVDHPIDYVGAGLYSTDNAKTRLRSSSLGSESKGDESTGGARKTVAFAPVLRTASPPANKQRLGYIGAGIYWDSTQPFDKHLVCELLHELKSDGSDGEHVRATDEPPKRAAPAPPVRRSAAIENRPPTQSQSSVETEVKSSTVSEPRSSAASGANGQVSEGSSKASSSRRELRRSQSDSFVTRSSNASLSRKSEQNVRNFDENKAADRTASTVSTLTALPENVSESTHSGTDKSEIAPLEAIPARARTISAASSEKNTIPSLTTRSISNVSKTRESTKSAASERSDEDNQFSRRASKSFDAVPSDHVSSHASSGYGDDAEMFNDDFEDGEDDENIFEEEEEDDVQNPAASRGGLSISIPSRSSLSRSNDAAASTASLSLMSSLDSPKQGSQNRNSSPGHKSNRSKGDASPTARLLMRPESYYKYDPSRDIALKEALTAPHSNPNSPIPWVPASKLIPGQSPIRRSTSDPDLKSQDQPSAGGFVCNDIDVSLGDSEPSTFDSIPLFSARVAFPGANELYKHKRQFSRDRKSSLRGSAVQVKHG